MPQLALPATSATYTHIHIHFLTLFSLPPASLSPARITYLSILLTHGDVYAKHTHTYIRQPAHIPDRLASCFYSVRPRSLASKDRLSSFSLFLLSSFSFLLPFPLILSSRFLYLFLPFFLSLSFINVSILPSFSLPLVVISILESKHSPVLKRPFYSLFYSSLVVPRENTCQRS